ncbi:MAG: hypothetical protein OK439_03435 [Thaumarchaeota archaeon]|nr:hypothetical protein [Nitrososphaerota archaeon]
MTVSKLNGVIDGKNVKIIINERARGPEYFAHGKSGADISTPHIYDYSGNFSVHQDSPDGNYWRPMEIKYVASGILSSGINAFSKSGLSVVVLPTRDTTEGFVLDTKGSGITVSVANSEQPCVMAIGTFLGWRSKPQKIPTYGSY